MLEIRVTWRSETSSSETIAKAVAEKLNQYPSKNLLKFIIPQKGFSSLSVKGGALYDPVADKAFVDALRKYLDPGIRIIQVNTDINNSQFAQAGVEALNESLKR